MKREKCLILNLNRIQTMSQEAQEHKFTHETHEKANKVQTGVMLTLASRCLRLALFDSSPFLPSDFIDCMNPQIQTMSVKSL